MSGFLASARFATVLALALGLVLTGIAAGAAGQALILGQVNTSGSSATIVDSTNTTRTLLVRNTSASGFAIEGRSSGGIGGQFVSSTSTGMSGFTSAAAANGVVGTHNGTAYGGGAAILGDGRQNHGVSGTSRNDSADAVRGVHVATAADFGSFEYANGVYGETRAVDGNGVLGNASAASGFGYGVWGMAGSPDGAAVVGSPGGSGALAGLFEGDVDIAGTLFVGSCTGCTAALAVVAAEAIAQGDAVAIEGVRAGPGGEPFLVVRRATQGDAVIGVADVTLVARENARTGARLVRGKPGADAGGWLSVVTAGLMAYDAAPAIDGLAPGTDLISTAAGTLAAAGSEARDRAVATVAGVLEDGRVVLLVRP